MRISSYYLILIILSLRFIQPVSAAQTPIGILGIPSETDVLLPMLSHKRTTRILGIAFISGDMDGVPVALARSGIGKVNAAMTAALMIDHFHPSFLLFTGSAGALNPSLSPGDVVIGERTAEHDVGTITAQGMQHEATYGINGRNPLFFPADPTLLKAAQMAAKSISLQPVDTGMGSHIPRIITGVIVTGDLFVASEAENSELRTYFHADATEEEGAAVAQVCWETRIPFLAIRSISDNANGQTPVNYRKFYKLAANNSALLVKAIIADLK